MDQSQRQRHGRRQRPSSSQRNSNTTTQEEQQQEDSSLRQRPQVQSSRSASYMTSVPPPQWQDIPLPYRPRDFEQYRHYTVPESLYAWRLRPLEEQQTSRTSQRRSSPPQDIPGRERFQAAAAGIVDPSFLNPQTSPNFSTFSAPDDPGSISRAVSQPGMPSRRRGSPQRPALELPPVYVVPRSPTYPPAGRRRVRSTNNLPEPALAEVEDFHLFAQATAGLEPDQAFRLSGSPSSDSSEHGDTNPDQQQSPSVEQLVSPLQETPTTMLALQQLAQMPQGSSSMHYSHTRVSHPPLARGRSAIVTSTDTWLHPPDDPYEDDEDGQIDDELPDYAMSQAQAQAAQRAEAARRAQELQRRWQQSR